MSPARFTIAIPHDHPAFEGHFPGLPILPGVVLLAEVLAGIEEQLGGPLDNVLIKVAKFHATVGPGARLEVELSQVGGLAFTVSSEGTRVATGTLAIGAPGSGQPAAGGGGTR